VAPPTTGVVNLGALDPSVGFTISGVSGLDFGGLVSNAGDMNGDGIDDFLVIEPTGVTGAFLIYGRSGGFADFTTDELILGVEGARIFSLNDSIDDVAGIGDINNDGIADIAIGSAFGPAGDVAIIYGKLGGLSGEIDFQNLALSDGFIISEPSGSTGSFAFARSVAAAGDVNGDGIDDFIIGDPTGDGASRKGSQAGDAYVIYGRDSSQGDIFADFSIDNLGTDEGFRILGGKAIDQLGISVSSAGDLNDDGYDDVVVGALAARASGKGLTGGEGISYVIYGGATGTDIDLTSLSPGHGFRIIGADPDDRMGRSVSNAGDVNGDGIDDIVVGAYFAAGDGNLEPQAGEAYVIFGSTSGFSDIDVGALEPGQGIRIVGADPGDFTGIHVSSAGDVNGDGFDDVLIAAPWAAGANDDAPTTGEVYLLWGKEDLADIDLGAFSAADGIRFLGAEADDYAGWAVSAAGDINDDGYDDILIGAFGAEQAYVIYGAQDLML